MENIAKILYNVPISRDIWKMELETPIAKEAKPGQFVMVEIPAYFLRRPISISDTTDHSLTLIYKTMGKGTEIMSHMEPGDTLNLVGPLGQGFPVVARDEVVLIGGGVGVPPLLKTAKAWLATGAKVHVVMGFNTSAEIFYQDAFEQIGIRPVIATMDGSYGVKGTVLDAIAHDNITCPFIMACGPLPMLKALQNAYTEGYISLEARMGCGIGVCMGCVVTDTNGMSLRVCKNGPVFPIGKVVL